MLVIFVHWQRMPLLKGNDMEITVNGEVMTLSDDVKTVAGLIASLDIAHRKYFIVEKNREVVMKEDYETESVNHHDYFEIVHFVGGG